ncbi:MAG: hypothetical protein LC122_05050 [Chitinophagales bacterium]|nr:hypothetical protein [Chitinophagales bacterium]
MKRILFLLVLLTITNACFAQAKIYDGQTIKARTALIVGGKTITDIVDDTTLANKYKSRLMSEWSIKTVMANNYAPTSRTITINGTTYDLSSNRTWSVGDVKLASNNTFIGVNTFGNTIYSNLISSSSVPIYNLQKLYSIDVNYARSVLSMNALWNSGTKLWDINAIGSNDAQAILFANGEMQFILHPNTGNTARTFTHADFLGGAKLKINGNSGNAVFSNNVTASSFIKSGGTSSQFLKADGSVDNNSYTISNSAITGATKTKITYDAKGLITAGADATTDDITEGSNLYYTNTRARSALSFTAGSGGYNSSTGVITIPTNTNQLTNGAGFTTNTGTVTSVGGTGSVNGLTLSGSITTSGNLTLGGTISGLTTSNLASNAGITNGQLANNKINIGGTDVGLGSSITKDGIMGISTDGIVLRKGTNTYMIATPGGDYQVPITGGASTITTSNLTNDRVLISNGSGKVATSSVTSTTLGYLDATSSIQTQLNNKQNVIPNGTGFLKNNGSGTWSYDGVSYTPKPKIVKHGSSTYILNGDENYVFAENGATITLPALSSVADGYIIEFGLINTSSLGDQYEVECHSGDVFDVPLNCTNLYVQTAGGAVGSVSVLSTKIMADKDNDKWLVLQATRMGCY